MKHTVVKVPDLGGAESVDVIELTLNKGDSIEEEESILVLESDKATMDVPSPVGGIFVKYLVSEGDTVSVGDPLAEIETNNLNEQNVQKNQNTENPETEPESDTEIETKIEAVKETETQTANEIKQDPVKSFNEENIQVEVIHAGPSVRMLARELGVDLSEVSGSGPKSRITKDDVHNFIKLRLGKSSNTTKQSSEMIMPSVDIPPFDNYGENSVRSMSKIQKITSLNMQKNWLNVPHVTQFDNADITDLEEFRGKHKNSALEKGIKLTPVAFVIKAVAIALQDNPEFNRSPLNDRDNYVQKEYVNIGMAVDTEKGLFVPVIKSADKMGVWEIAKNVLDMADKARNGALTPNEMQGGCFTVSSLGAIGGNGFTPIVNSPEIGILGVSKAQIKPVWIDSEFVPRLMLPLSLSYDHRLINGGNAGKFLTSIVRLLSDVRTMIL